MSVFPFINPEAFLAENSIEELPRYCEYAYDFENNCLKLKNGTTYFIYENDALTIWIYKALIAERYRHIAYSNDYGSELTNLVGANLSKDVLQSEIKRYITEALMVCPYIKELNDFSFDDNSVFFRCKTVYGVIELGLKGDDREWTLVYPV